MSAQSITVAAACTGCVCACEGCRLYVRTNQLKTFTLSRCRAIEEVWLVIQDWSLQVTR